MKYPIPSSWEIPSDLLQHIAKLPPQRQQNYINGYREYQKKLGAATGSVDVDVAAGSGGGGGGGRSPLDYVALILIAAALFTVAAVTLDYLFPSAKDKVSSSTETPSTETPSIETPTSVGDNVVTDDTYWSWRSKIPTQMGELYLEIIKSISGLNKVLQHPKPKFKMRPQSNKDIIEAISCSVRNFFIPNNWPNFGFDGSLQSIISDVASEAAKNPAKSAVILIAAASLAGALYCVSCLKPAGPAGPGEPAGPARPAQAAQDIPLPASTESFEIVDALASSSSEIPPIPVITITVTPSNADSTDLYWSRITGVSNVIGESFLEFIKSIFG